MAQRRSSIRALLRTLTAALAGPLFLLFGLAQQRWMEADRVRADLQGQANAVALAMEQFLEKSESLLAGIAQDVHVRSLDPEDCGVHFPECRTLLGTSWRTGAREAREFRVRPVQRGLRTERWITVLSYPVEDLEGERRGAVLLAVALVEFEKILGMMNPKREGIISVTEEGGVVVARSQDSEIHAGRRSPAPAPGSDDDSGTASRGFTEALSFEGVMTQFAFSRVPGCCSREGVRSPCRGPRRRNAFRPPSVGRRHAQSARSGVGGDSGQRGEGTKGGVLFRLPRKDARHEAERTPELGAHLQTVHLPRSSRSHRADSQGE